MDRTPPPVTLADALALPRTPGRSAEILIDGEMEIRFAAKPSNGPQTPHLRDEFYAVARGTARYRVEDRVSEVGPGDLLFAAAGAPHGFEDPSEDFCVWVMFYGAAKPYPNVESGK